MKNEIVQVDRQLAEKIECPHIEEGGFQRKLSEKRIAGIAANLESVGFCPPIVVGKVNGNLLLIDGQHRLEAWRRGSFPLFACIVPMDSAKEAAKNFMEINGSAVRVSVTHRLKIDPSKQAEQLRDLAAKYEVKENLIFHIVQALEGFRSWNIRDVKSVTFKVANDILKEWSDDPRWETEDGVYCKPGTLKIVSYFVRQSQNPHAVVKKLKTMDWRRPGPLYERIGTSNQNQIRMRDYIIKTLGGA